MITSPPDAPPVLITRAADAALPPVVARLVGAAHRRERLRHVELIPAREGATCPWPAWADGRAVAAWQASGIALPWRHQVDAAEKAWSGHDVVIATGTASGKSLAYLLPVVTAIRAGLEAPSGRGATALYLAPTKALAADQLSSVLALELPGLRASTYDGDTPPEERRWIREHAGLVLTNPDLVHHSLLPNHARWKGFLRALRYIVVDECHHYRGVFGSHVAAVLRRLQRVAMHYGAEPTFVLASATASDPGMTALKLTGRPAVAVTDDTSPRGRTAFAFWQPPLLPGGGEHDAPTRRPAVTESADLLADLVASGTRTLAFVASRRGVETLARSAQRHLAEVAPHLSQRVAAYRGGYLPEERRELEASLRNGELLGLAATSALELGVDIAGLDAVLICGWPGRRTSLWQQAGRAGRRGADALAILVARDDPLDTYLMHHPDAVFGQPVESTVLDPDNPYVLAPHLCAAAAELPLRPNDVELFGPSTAELLDLLVDRGLLRRRPAGWYWTARSGATELADLRGTGGEPVKIVEGPTGRVLGSVDARSSHHTVHEGAVYLHQGESFLVRRLSLDESLALVEPTGHDVATQAREVSDVRILAEKERMLWGSVTLAFGSVEITSRVVSFVRRHVRTGQVLGEEPLDLPERTLQTAAAWFTIPGPLLVGCGLTPERVPGAAHAAEHAAIGMLPLVATSDRWDVGGLSTALHPDTGMATIFVHDGHPGGAGFAERGYRAAATWLRATCDMIGDCSCGAGCPSCVQSPKCGNGNEPLDKTGAVALLDAVLDAVPRDQGDYQPEVPGPPLTGP